MTPELEEAIITLIDERIDERINGRIDERIRVVTTQQTQRIDRLENAMVQLANAQSQSFEVQKQISHQLHDLTSIVTNMQKDIHTVQENQRTMQGDIRTMQGDIRTLKENQHTMQGDIRRLDNRVAQLAGDSLEERYSKHAAAYLGRALRKVKAFKPYVMEDQFRAKLSESDYEDLLLVDLLVRGIPKGHKGIHVWLAFEISVVVDRKDVERAIRRAEILRRCDFISIPAVAGESLTEGAEILAAAREVVVVTNGKIGNWKEALTRALEAKG